MASETHTAAMLNEEEFSFLDFLNKQRGLVVYSDQQSERQSCLGRGLCSAKGTLWQITSAGQQALKAARATRPSS